MQFYRWLLANGRRHNRRDRQEFLGTIANDWLGMELGEAVGAMWTAGQWIPQEALGFEALQLQPLVSAPMTTSACVARRSSTTRCMSNPLPPHTDPLAVTVRLSEDLPWPLSWALRGRIGNLSRQHACRSAPPALGFAVVGTTPLFALTTSIFSNPALQVAAILMAALAAMGGLRILLWQPLWKVGWKPHLRAVTAMSPRAHLYVTVLSSRCATYFMFDLLLACALALSDVAGWRKNPEIQGDAENALDYLPYEGGHSYNSWLLTRYVDENASDRTRHGNNLSGAEHPGLCCSPNDVERTSIQD